MKIERWGWYSIAVNTVLAALHALVAIVSGSLAVAAELVHNVVDLLAAVAVLTGLKLATRQSKAFPYGLYKVEKGKGRGYVLRDAGLRLRVSERPTLAEALDEQIR